jgi:hypothetical protein
LEIPPFESLALMFFFGSFVFAALHRSGVVDKGHSMGSRLPAVTLVSFWSPTELRRSTLLAGGTAQTERVPAILDDRVRSPLAVGARRLKDALKSQDAPTAEFT